MLRDGFLRFCNDPEIACCKAERELEQLRTENASLREQLAEAQRRADAAVKCIEDVETYLGLGSAKYIKKTIDAWRGTQDEKGE